MGEGRWEDRVSQGRGWGGEMGGRVRQLRDKGGDGMVREYRRWEEKVE